MEERDPVPVWDQGLSVYSESDRKVEVTDNLSVHNPAVDKELCFRQCCFYKHENFRYRLAKPSEYAKRSFFKRVIEEDRMRKNSKVKLNAALVLMTV
jgi:hypothetical protein